MSKLLSHLAGKTSQILYRKYFSIPANKNKHLCLLRFEIDGWSTIVYGISKTRYLAGARALQHYVDFCRAHDVEFRDEDGSMLHRWDSSIDYELSDEAYGESFSVSKDE